MAYGMDGILSASFHFYKVVSNRRRHRVANPSQIIHGLLHLELSLRRLDEMSEHLWLAGARRSSTQLHLQVALGRNIVFADRIDLHLLWNGDGRIFTKPIPRFLLSLEFWRTDLGCVEHCRCLSNSYEVAAERVTTIMKHPRTESKQSSITPCTITCGKLL
jgi:hypothetical protein